ncbi:MULTISPECIES: copper chaperone PCu(A)C [Asticcacaulis]|uniref:copper chaperone PCu(A)C n=1 Tax=Asticcacaulis TaxID=76890 RepID=UPI001AE6457C|nr:MULTISPECIES: copper chaperone PCu(A)C [Asticcacaulis]MBP2159963.1 copper(I)-binding protein [Asticcacaulis solisilvae]MDR6801008.1 copper(I)-binding protein [Asticcacaulis sp. BE141]
MKHLAALTLAALALAACDGKSTTTVSKSSNINGVVTSSTISMTDYAMRAALGNNPNTAAYVTVRNTGTEADRLISASCECAASTELHSMTTKDGVMDMAEMKDGFVVAPGETLVLKPGGNHIMLLGLKVRPQDGSTVKVKLTFEKAGDITLAMPVSNTPLSKTTAQ